MEGVISMDGLGPFASVRSAFTLYPEPSLTTKVFTARTPISAEFFSAIYYHPSHNREQ